jgi:hypothetical protein
MDTIEGLPEEEAKVVVEKAGYDYRIEERNGEALEVKDNHRTDRISMKVEDGVVVSVRVG